MALISAKITSFRQFDDLARFSYDTGIQFHMPCVLEDYMQHESDSAWESLLRDMIAKRLLLQYHIRICPEVFEQYLNLIERDPRRMVVEKTDYEYIRDLTYVSYEKEIEQIHTVLEIGSGFVSEADTMARCIINAQQAAKAAFDALKVLPDLVDVRVGAGGKPGILYGYRTVVCFNVETPDELSQASIEWLERYDTLYPDMFIVSLDTKL